MSVLQFNFSLFLPKMETLNTVRHWLEVSIQQNYFLIGIFKWRHKKLQSGNSACIINSRLYSLGAGLTLFVDSVEVLFAFAHGVCLWCACEQHCRTIKTIKCYPKIIHKIFIKWWYVEWLVTLSMLHTYISVFQFHLDCKFDTCDNRMLPSRCWTCNSLLYSDK